jgi:hypothetical protein
MTDTNTLLTTTHLASTNEPLSLVQEPQAPIPLPPLDTPFQDRETAAARLPAPDREKARAAQEAQRHHWASLSLRQEWADKAFMRGHLRVAGVKVADNTEPATAKRMKAKLRAVGIRSPEIHEAVGMPLDRFLAVNPRLPLWAALALVLESTGRFTPKGFSGVAA